MAERDVANPLIIPADVKPSSEQMRVVCTMNAGACIFRGQTILLLRVAEAGVQSDQLSVPVFVPCEGKVRILEYNKKTQVGEFDFSDSRVVVSQRTKEVVGLTSLSHIRIARSADGVHFTVETRPFIFPSNKHETWGIEDPRVSCVDGRYFITYTAVSEFGAATALAVTDDFETSTKLGIIFPPENKDVCIFPEQIGGKFVAYHRPVPKGIGNADMWTAQSPDMISWGGHEHMLSGKDGTWEGGRIGGGAPSIRTSRGWVHIYHAADESHRYCLGAFLAALDNPGKILAKTTTPILQPSEPYEKDGFFGNVVFSCGVILKDQVLWIYYGAADDKVALCRIALQKLFSLMQPV